MTTLAKKQVKKYGNYAGRYAILIFWLLVSLLPIYVAITASLTPFSKLGQPFILPKYFYWQNYVELFQQTPVLNYLKSSLIYALGTSLVALVIAIFSAYAMSRFKFKGKFAFATLMVAIQIIPQIIIVLPLYAMVNNLGAYDTYYSVIIAMSATAIASPILLLKSFFDGISTTIEEAAMIDGCNRASALFRVIIPISLPAVVTAFALAFFSGWDVYLYPMVMTSDPGKVPMTVGMSRMVDIVTPWNWVMAGTVLGIIPPILIYFIAQKYLITGLTAGSDK